MDDDEDVDTLGRVKALSRMFLFICLLFFVCFLATTTSRLYYVVLCSILFYFYFSVISFSLFQSKLVIV